MCQKKNKVVDIVESKPDNELSPPVNKILFGGEAENKEKVSDVKEGSTENKAEKKTAPFEELKENEALNEALGEVNKNEVQKKSAYLAPSFNSKLPSIYNKAKKNEAGFILNKKFGQKK